MWNGRHGKPVRWRRILDSKKLSLTIMAKSFIGFQGVRYGRIKHTCYNAAQYGRATEAIPHSLALAL